MRKYYIYDTEVCRLGIAENDGKISHVIIRDTDSYDFGDAESGETDLIKRTFDEISEYLRGERKEFDIPLEAEGSDFEKSVWKALLTIPYGETRSYGDIAKYLDKPNHSRVVGRANGRNPISIIVPCHRVIGASGKLVGYGGGLDMKEKLLRLENAQNVKY